MKPQRSYIGLRLALATLAALGLSACSSNKVSAPAPTRTVVVDSGTPSTPPRQAPAPAVGVPAPAPAVSRPAPAPSAAAPVARPQPAVVPSASEGYRMPEGIYRCDEGVRIVIKQTSSDGQSVTINSNGKDTLMKFIPVSSGAVRYENAASKLAWILTADKGMLFDNRKGQRLANNCKL